MLGAGIAATADTGASSERRRKPAPAAGDGRVFDGWLPIYRPVETPLPPCGFRAAMVLENLSLAASLMRFGIAVAILTAVLPVAMTGFAVHADAKEFHICRSDSDAYCRYMEVVFPKPLREKCDVDSHSAVTCARYCGKAAASNCSFQKYAEDPSLDNFHSRCGHLLLIVKCPETASSPIDKK